MSVEMVEMDVAGVAQLPDGVDVVVLQERGGDRSLGIGVTSHAAAAIGVHLAGVRLPRPGTYVLVVTVLAGLEGGVLRAVLDDNHTDQAVAFLEVTSARGIMEFPCAAGDAVAVAAHAGAPVLVHPALFWRDGAPQGQPDG